MIGNAIFRRESQAVARRPRTYALQTLFLAGLVCILIPLWPTGRTDGSAISDSGRLIFEYGTYLECILIALLAPAATAGSITVEKAKNTLGLLLLTDAGPFSIIFGKLGARTAALTFLLVLSTPVIFAVLTLGGIDARSIGIAFVILISLAWLGCSLGVLLSTVMRKTPGALMGGYFFIGTYLFLPELLELNGLLAKKGARGAGTVDPHAAWLSPLHDITYLFEPGRYVASESFPQSWWVNPAINIAAGAALAILASLLLPSAKDVEKAFDVRRSLELLDRFLARLMPGSIGKKVDAESRPGPKNNPIYWKETNVNTLGRFRHWWRVNLLLSFCLIGSYWVFKSHLQEIEFHKVVCAVLSSVLILASTVISANAVAKEREERTLEVLATTPIECATYVQGKVGGIMRNLIFLLVLPLAHVVVWTICGPIHPLSLVICIAFPIVAVEAVLQGILVSLMFPTTLRALMAAIVVIALEAALPFCCCLPTFNPPLLGYYVITDAGHDFEWALDLGTLFSTGAHAGLMLVVYSLIRSGFDRYIGRAG